MKKSLLIIFPLLFGATLVSCGGESNPTAITSGEENADYYLVTYEYNNPLKSGTYLTSVVMKDQALVAPKEPNIENQVFEGWYRDKECTKEFLRFGLEINSSVTLYAKWSDYASLPIGDQVSRFQSIVAELSEGCVQVVQELNAGVMYPAIAGTEVLGVKDRYVFKRYDGITTKDYYGYDEEDTPTLYGQEQFYCSDGKFYDIYHDLEDPSRNENYVYTYKVGTEDACLAIGYSTFFKSLENKIVSAVESGKYDSDTLEYVFTGNYTTLSANLDTYTYEEYLAYATYSEEIGTYGVEMTSLEIGLVIDNGKIKSANVFRTYAFILGEDIYQYVEETNTLDFYYSSGALPTFTGEKFKPNLN